MKTMVQISMLITLVYMMATVDCRQDRTSSANSITGRQVSLPLHRRSSAANDSRHVIYFLSDVSNRRRRVQRSIVADRPRDISGPSQSGVVLNQLPDYDGSGSDEFELTPGLSFPLLADKEDISETTTGQFSASKTASTTTKVNENSNYIQSTVSRPHDASLPSGEHTGGPTQLTHVETDGGAKPSDIVTNSQQRHLAVTSTTVTLSLVTTQSPDGSTDNTFGDRQERVVKDNQLNTLASAEAKSNEESVVPTVKAWVIVISAVIGAILICVIVVVAIRLVVVRRKVRSQWLNGHSNGNSNHATSTI